MPRRRSICASVHSFAHRLADRPSIGAPLAAACPARAKPTIHAHGFSGGFGLLIGV